MISGLKYALAVGACGAFLFAVDGANAATNCGSFKVSNTGRIAVDRYKGSVSCPAALQVVREHVIKHHLVRGWSFRGNEAKRGPWSHPRDWLKWRQYKMAPPPSPPAVPAITGQPANPTTSTSATFTVTDADATATLRCKLDAGAFRACTSPKGYIGLAVGSHNFTVMARDHGLTSAPAVYAWQIQAPPPPPPPPPPSPQNYWLADRTPVEDSAFDLNRTLRINGVTYTHLIYGEGGSYTGDTAYGDWDLERKCATFDATIGLRDDSPDTNAQIRYEFYLDSRLVLTRDMNYGQATSVHLDLTGVLRFKLETIRIDSKPHAWADGAFGDPVINCTDLSAQT